MILEENINLNYTPLNIYSHAIRTCWQSFEKGDNGGEKDVELIERVGNKFKHASTLEHLSYNFYIQGISRALLQELARHRVASLSVKSTRYTLKPPARARGCPSGSARPWARTRSLSTTSVRRSCCPSTTTEHSKETSYFTRTCIP